MERFTLFALLAAFLAAVPVFGHPFNSNSYRPSLPCSETYQSVETKFVSINGTDVAYRRLGKPHKFPLVYLHHLRGSMDVLDPLFVNTIAKNREIIVFDSFGIGHSQGQVPDSIEAMGEVAVAFINKLGLKNVDLLGFSLGGMVAQYISIQHPQLPNKLILAGTQPSGHDPVVLAKRFDIQQALSVDVVTAENLVPLFFSPSKTSTALGQAWFKRFDERHVKGEENKGFLRGAGVLAQAAALNNWTSSGNWFNRLGEIKASVLVTGGHNDLMTPTPNSFLLQQALAKAQLHIYPDSGHGHLFQYPDNFAAQLELFLAA
ncbi:hypothetical protein IL306_013814 [Fusarium sp. DS 682]|nr:hypothetical protein IL306_013814 [Fusarium sp. DS 682]